MLGVLLVLRMFPVLRDHLNANSSFKVGKIWLTLVGVIVPLVLLAMFTIEVVNVIRTPYNGYPHWFNNLFGWGAIVLMAVLTAIFTAIRWRQSPDEFIPEPTLPGERISARALVAPGARHAGSTDKSDTSASPSSARYAVDVNLTDKEN